MGYRLNSVGLGVVFPYLLIGALIYVLYRLWHMWRTGVAVRTMLQGRSSSISNVVSLTPEASLEYNSSGPPGNEAPPKYSDVQQVLLEKGDATIKIPPPNYEEIVVVSQTAADSNNPISSR